MMKRTSNKYSSRVYKQAGKRKNIIQLIENLKKPDIAPNADLKALYYQDKAKKHSF